MNRRGHCHTYPAPSRARFSPVRMPDPVARRWQRQYADSAEFWRTVGPTIRAAAAYGFDRVDLMGVLERAVDGDPSIPLQDRIVEGLADAIEGNQHA